MLKAVLIVVAALVVVVAAALAYAATKPDKFRVERSLAIKAPPDKIFAQINDLRAWAAWSPYEAKDPAMQSRFSGPASGKGAVYAWDGNSNVGKGRMEITDAAPDSKVTFKLNFLSPFVSQNIAVFTLAPEGETTRVTWTMEGPAPFITKVMDMIFNMDKMIGADFATGLANLKTIAKK